MPKQVKLSPLGEYLRTVRMKENMSAEEMAKMLGMSLPMLYKVETGARPAPQDFVRKYEMYVKYHLHLTNYDDDAKHDLVWAWLSSVEKVEVTGVDEKPIAYALLSATADQLKRIKTILTENTDCMD